MFMLIDIRHEDGINRIIRDTLGQINALNKPGNQVLKLEDMPLDDELSFEILNRCQTHAVFDLESFGIREVIRYLKPCNIHDIKLLFTLFRPSVLKSGIADEIIAQRFNNPVITYPHPDLVDILDQTYGKILFKEQFFKITALSAGLNREQSRRFKGELETGDKKSSRQQRKNFVKLADQNRFNAETANAIFNLIKYYTPFLLPEIFVDKCAVLSYRSLYLKTHYPAFYMSSVLNEIQKDPEKVTIIVNECKRIGIIIAPPDINYSDRTAKAINDETILYGFYGIKGLTTNWIEQIILDRKLNGPFRSIRDFLKRLEIDKNKRSDFKWLIKSGAFREINEYRQEFSDSNRNQSDYELKLQSLSEEKEALGIYLSGHPFEIVSWETSKLIKHKIIDLFYDQNHIFCPQRLDNYAKNITVCGLVDTINSSEFENSQVASMTVTDSSESIEAVIYPDRYRQFLKYLIPGKFLVLSGQIKNDTYNNKMVMKVNQAFSLGEYRALKAKGIQLYLDDMVNDRVSIERLKKLLTDNEGSLLVNLLTETKKSGYIDSIINHSSVLPTDELMYELSQMVGTNNISINY